MLINEVVIEGYSFTFTSVIEVIDSITYVVRFNYEQLGKVFIVKGDCEEEEFSVLSLAIEYQNELIHQAKINRFHARKAVLTHLSKCWNKAGDRELTLSYIKQELIVVDKYEDEENEVSSYTYTYKDYVIIETYAGLDKYISVILEGIEVYGITFAFEDPCWSSVEEVLEHFLSSR